MLQELYLLDRVKTQELLLLHSLILSECSITPTSLSSVLRTLSNGSCQNVASAITTLFQIVNDTIANTGYLQSVDRVESPLGLSFGPSVNANATTTNSYLYFTN